MKIAFLLTSVLLSLSCFAQPGDGEIEEVWNTHVQAIIELDQEGIRKQCNDFVGGEWGYIIGLETEPETWTVDELVANAEILFLEEEREDLKYGDPSMFELVEGENGFELHLTLYSEFEEDGEVYESATILVYQIIDGEWKLCFIYLAG